MILVSVIVPCYNEEDHIQQLLDAITRQSFPLHEVEVIIADGLSTDTTRALIQNYSDSHPQLQVKVIDNPRRVIPSALNRAIETSCGRYIIRLDAHSVPDSEYIQKCVDNLENGLGDNVGGVWIIKPGKSSWIARAISVAASHPLAVGDALYRIGGKAQLVDTVPFGAFRRELFDKIGKFDELLLTNEDYEFNVRVRKAGGKIWMDPSIQSTYFSRSTLKELSRQYWRYGYWKAQMLRRYPESLRIRQLLPPMFVLALGSLGFLSLFWPLARLLLAIIVLLYILVVFLASFQASIKFKDLTLIIGLPLAIASIHLAWGTALLWGLVSKPPVPALNR